MLCADVPEVNKDDAEPIEGVEHNSADQPDFRNTHERSLVGANHGVVGLRAHPNKSCVQDVNEKEEVDADSCNAVENPGPHAFSSAVERPSRDNAFLARGGNLDGHRWRLGGPRDTCRSRHDPDPFLRSPE